MFPLIAIVCSTATTMGSAWQYEVVDEDPHCISSFEVGRHSCIALDSQGRPHISYSRDGHLWYASARPSAVATERISPGSVLLRPVPDPFVDVARIHLQLDRGSHCRAEIRDLQGRRVRMLASTYLEARAHELIWDGKDRHGRRVPAGVYYAVVRSAGDRGRTRMLRLR
ncbi:MAG: hypothetical protein GF330_05810 [Candidatus Eisenbacteria bacterium]|nr:hypothetical protein [Candidatus Eisenbacteria bacterium]